MRQDFHQIAKRLEPVAKPKILLVGFYHFANPKRDMVKADLDDHLSPKRQKEILALVERLAKFKPTKIAIEQPFGSTEVNDAYNKWLAGESPLGVAEQEQVGFRLAKQFGQKQLYPIDYHLDLDFDPTMALAGKEMPDKMQQIQAMFGAAQGVVEGFRTHTVLENLRVLNDPEADRLGNGMYLRMASVVKGDLHPGADMAANWWKRNLTWLANLSTVATNPDDRVLVICGSAHASLIRSLLRDSIDMEAAPVMPYLK